MIDFTTWTQRNSKRGLVPKTTSDRNTPFGMDAYNEMVRKGYEKLAEEALEEVAEWVDDAVEDVSDFVDSAVDALPFEALRKQVSGSHYADQAIEPIDYVMANDLGYCEGNVVKYVTRHKLKNGKEDILKAIHYLEFILEFQYGEES